MQRSECITAGRGGGDNYCQKRKIYAAAFALVDLYWSWSSLFLRDLRCWNTAASTLLQSDNSKRNIWCHWTQTILLSDISEVSPMYLLFSFSKMIYQSEEEGALNKFIYLKFRCPTHSSSFCLCPTLLRPGIIVGGGWMDLASALGEPLLDFFFGVPT